MRLPVLQRRVSILCLICILAACAGNPSFNAQPTGTPNLPTAQLTVEQAEHVAADFLNAWQLDSYEGMYGVLTVNSRDAYPRQDFEQLYTDTERTITLLPGGKSYVLTNAIRQGAGAADVAYDMTFKTRLFGDFTDTGRILHLVTTPDGWRVAWSAADVFAEMKDGGRLDTTETMPTRANIYDRDGDVIADENGIAVRVTLHTQSYPGGNPDNCFGELARVFKARTAEQMKALYGPRTGLDYIYDIGELSQDAIAAEKAALERVCTRTYSSVPTRRYVAGGLAPHIIGHVGRIPAEELDQW